MKLTKISGVYKWMCDPNYNTNPSFTGTVNIGTALIPSITKIYGDIYMYNLVNGTSTSTTSANATIKIDSNGQLFKDYSTSTTLSNNLTAGSGLKTNTTATTFNGSVAQTWSINSQYVPLLNSPVTANENFSTLRYYKTATGSDMWYLDTLNLYSSIEITTSANIGVSRNSTTIIGSAATDTSTIKLYGSIYLPSFAAGTLKVAANGLLYVV